MVIYVGNLNYSISEEDLNKVFSDFGNVDSVKIIRDKMTGRAKGFGFVDMPDDSEAETAIKELDGKELMGRNMRVNPSRPPQER
jgi:RNA recognition motif-containing protein